MPVTLRGSAIFVGALFISISAKAGIFGDAPDVVICPLESTVNREAGHVVFYIDGTEDDTPFYKPLGNNPVQLSVNDNGTLDTRIPSCAGKSLDELRQGGLAFDFN
ncbi:hypothetical protein PsW64_01558 [Pseudovibrio sp. W64]|uniref:hypothetical protein n=1 Tax=Pseudovibrio sp. W64 TaxID=1735583 RepID=UPI0007AE7921|nr:hypothetical protein [Pseudovibrio sp. W64]KZK86305.1 hypothetical protein PsW64_01558 [Pseudovibrio sp. W64]